MLRGIPVSEMQTQVAIAELLRQLGTEVLQVSNHGVPEETGTWIFVLNGRMQLYSGIYARILVASEQSGTVGIDPGGSGTSSSTKRQRHHDYDVEIGRREFNSEHE